MNDDASSRKVLSAESEPLWKQDFPYEAAEEDEVTRREFARYLAIGAGVMAAGNVGLAENLVIGLVGAAAGTRLMERLLFGVSATDPMTFAAAAVVLGIASVAATCIPALRAARVAPVTALRCE